MPFNFPTHQDRPGAVDGPYKIKAEYLNNIQDAVQQVGTLTVRRPTVVSLGDSITSNGINNGGPGSLNWLMHACVASEGHLFWQDSVGGGGYKTAQIRTELLPIVLDLDPRPGYCAILAGPNDTGVTDFAEWSADYSLILDGLSEAGILPVLCAIVPSDTSSKHEAAVQFNVWLSREARRRGVPFVNWLPDLMDPATGGNWLAGLEEDGTHPITAGAVAMGNALWRELEPWLEGQPRWEPMLATSNTDVHNLHENGLFLTDTNTDGIADNIGVSDGGAGSFGDYATMSLEDPSNGDCVGKWQKLTRVDEADTFTTFFSNATITAAPGDRISVCCRFACEIASADPPGGIGQVGLYRYNTTTQAAGVVDGEGGTRQRWLLNGWTTDIDPTTLYGEYTVWDSVDNGIRFICNFASGEGSLQIAQLTVRNLTTMGLA